MDDSELLRDFACNASESAFAALVERYVGLVYHAALRQVRDLHHAQDITQVVFPNREYWLAPEHRGEMFDCIFHNYLWMACFAALHMLAIQLLVIYANHQTPTHFPTWAALGIGGCFIVAVLFRVGLMIRYFKKI